LVGLSKPRSLQVRGELKSAGLQIKVIKQREGEGESRTFGGVALNETSTILEVLNRSILCVSECELDKSLLELWCEAPGCGEAERLEYVFFSDG